MILIIAFMKYEQFKHKFTCATPRSHPRSVQTVDVVAVAQKHQVRARCPRRPLTHKVSDRADAALELRRRARRDKPAALRWRVVAGWRQCAVATQALHLAAIAEVAAPPAAVACAEGAVCKVGV